MSEALCFESIDELHRKLTAKELTSVELTETFLRRIEQKDTRLKSYITVAAEPALAMAKAADERLQKKKDVTPLTGIPLGLKDIFLTQGMRTTCASKILANFIPPYDATVVSRLRAAGSVFLGKLNMDEFAMGSSTENSHFGTSRNPWNIEHIPGGSSGGTAAAVAAGLSSGSLGTDTGGSIRQPSSHCSLVGLKPTYGRVSRYGVIAFASSLDQVGPMARSVRDAAHLLQVVAGHDPLDSTSAPGPLPHYAAALAKGTHGAKKVVLGIPTEYVETNRGAIAPDVLKAFEAAVARLKELGAEIRPVNLPHLDYAVAIYYIIAPAEASSNLARYDGVRYGHRSQSAPTLAELIQNSRAEGFGAEVKRRIMLGTYVLSAGYYDAYYLKAQKIRRLIREDFDRALTECDALISPVAPTPAFRIGEKSTDPLEMYLSDIFTIAVNLAGIPGLSVPCGFSSSGLPIGLQLMGKPFDEETLLRLAHAYEQSCEWVQRRPTV